MTIPESSVLPHMVKDAIAIMTAGLLHTDYLVSSASDEKSQNTIERGS